MLNNNASRRLKALRKYAKEHLDVPVNPFEIWSTNYDIKALDRLVNKYLKQQFDKIPQYEEKIKELEGYLDDVMTQVKKANIKKEINEYAKKIEEIRNKPNKYKEMASNILKEYLDVKDETRRMLIIDEFLRMVKNFYPHTIVQENLNTKSDYCFDCNVQLVEGEDIMHCPQCFREYEEREDYQNTSQKTKTHDPISYFEKVIDQVEGREYIEVPDSYKKKLDDLVEKMEMSKPLTRCQVVKLVYMCGDSYYYQHVSQVALQYANIPLPDYSSQRNILLEKYKQFSEVYTDIQKTLVSSLNGLFVIFKLLEMEDNDLELQDFKASISDQTLSQYDNIWQQACERLNWVYIETKN